MGFSYSLSRDATSSGSKKGLRLLLDADPLESLPDALPASVRLFLHGVCTANPIRFALSEELKGLSIRFESRSPLLGSRRCGAFSFPNALLICFLGDAETFEEWSFAGFFSGVQNGVSSARSSMSSRASMTSEGTSFATLLSNRSMVRSAGGDLLHSLLMTSSASSASHFFP
ncbi:hypothetical protein C4D60_Mb06t13790 [Musa balbisiana]|uniref:Uncharacterized protein n=1 Tax=Musa balbisiana TaxID=52838 RepID=A0A4S8IMT9_MUSBA|nr:hypothetical protein C4D60_Mb06t13790 [Musa balbisiana]